MLEALISGGFSGRIWGDVSGSNVACNSQGIVMVDQIRGHVRATTMVVCELTFLFTSFQVPEVQY